jgi:hypothetical protein
MHIASLTFMRTFSTLLRLLLMLLNAMTFVLHLQAHLYAAEAVGPSNAGRRTARPRVPPPYMVKKILSNALDGLTKNFSQAFTEVLCHHAIQIL